MALLSDEIKNDIKKVLFGMKDNVNIEVFTQKVECFNCKENREFVENIAGLSDKISVTLNDFESNFDRAAELGVNKIPAIVLLDKDKKDCGVKFYGIPAGYEINSFIKSILEISGIREDIPVDIMKRIKSIDKTVHIQVFVSLTCPYCPGTVVTAHRLAIENENIKADMVESSSFVYLTNKYKVMGVPKTIINETIELDGTQPINAILDAIEKL